MGSHPLIVRFMKGVFNMRPALPRHTEVWDVSVVLNLLRKWSPAKFLGIKELTLKLTMLMALVSAQRAQLLNLLDISNMVKGKSSYTFQINSTVKNSRAGHGPPTIVFKEYAPDKRLCVKHYLDQYLTRVKAIRRDKKLLISYKKPYRAVSKSTISRWIKTVMTKAGISETFTAHSTRAAAASAAREAGVPVEDILKTAGWSSCKIFAEYYNKPIQRNKEFSEAVLRRQ